MFLHLKSSYRCGQPRSDECARTFLMHGERHAYFRVRTVAHSGQGRTRFKERAGSSDPPSPQVSRSSRSCQKSESHDNQRRSVFHWTTDSPLFTIAWEVCHLTIHSVFQSYHIYKRLVHLACVTIAVSIVTSTEMKAKPLRRRLRLTIESLLFLDEQRMTTTCEVEDDAERRPYRRQPCK